MAALILALAAMSESSCAFVAPTTTGSKSLKAMSPFSTLLTPTVHHSATTASSTTRAFNLPRTSASNANGIENEEDGGGSIASSPRHSRMEKARTFGMLLAERMDTLEAAGFYESDDDDVNSSSGLLSDKDARGLVPMQAGVVRTGIQIAIAYWIFRKIKKASYQLIGYWRRIYIIYIIYAYSYCELTKFSFFGISSFPLLVFNLRMRTKINKTDDWKQKQECRGGRRNYDQRAG